MKKILVTMAMIGAVAMTTFAQGTLQFANRITTPALQTPVYGPDPASPTLSKSGQTTSGIPSGTQTYGGPLLAGTGFSVTFFAAAGQNVTDLNLFQAPASATAGSTITTFRTGTLAGYFPSSTLVYNNVPKDSAAGATGYVFAWDNKGGTVTDPTSALTAWLAGNLAAARSPLFNFNATTGGDFNTAPPSVNLVSFNIYTIPEPGTFVLAGLGAASLLLFRRLRK